MAVSGSISAFTSVSSIQPIYHVLQRFVAIQPKPDCAEMHTRICYVLKLLNDDVLPEKQQELLTCLLAIGTTSQGKSTPKLVAQLNQCLSLISNYLFYFQFDLSKFDNASSADLSHEIVVYIAERFNDETVVFYFPKPQHKGSLATGCPLRKQADSSHLVMQFQVSSEPTMDQNARVSRFIEEGHPSTQQSHSLQLHRRRIDNRARPYPPVRQPNHAAPDELCLPQPQPNPYAKPSCEFMLQSIESFLHLIPKKQRAKRYRS